MHFSLTGVTLVILNGFILEGFDSTIVYSGVNILLTARFKASVLTACESREDRKTRQ